MNIDPVARAGSVPFLDSILNDAIQTLRFNDAKLAIFELTTRLGDIRRVISDDMWASQIIPFARQHEVSKLIQECPLTSYSFSQPRGYPGDAGLLDIIYGHPSAAHAVQKASAIGRAIFEFTFDVPSSAAVRERRERVAKLIDDASEQNSNLRVLSLACGHLREAEISLALNTGRVHSLVALDQDPISLEVIAAYNQSVRTPIKAERITVKNIISGRHSLGQFDLTYAAWLYDYLQPKAAARLTKRLFSLLKPGGKLLIANFLTGTWEAPYMETFMDWKLIYRVESEIRDFAREIDFRECASIAYYTDTTGRIGYLELLRA